LEAASVAEAAAFGFAGAANPGWAIVVMATAADASKSLRIIGFLNNSIL
jgi:hypothetical protein